MKYTNSRDGIARTTLSVKLRFTKSEIEKIRDYLKREGRECSAKAIREFILEFVNDVSMRVDEVVEGEE